VLGLAGGTARHLDQQFVAQLAVVDSSYPFSHGLLRSMNSVRTPIRSNQLRTILAVNSPPLSERM
jgi:hypothetical protein